MSDVSLSMTPGIEPMYSNRNSLSSRLVVAINLDVKVKRSGGRGHIRDRRMLSKDLRDVVETSAIGF
jgi:hypothetical protein